MNRAIVDAIQNSNILRFTYHGGTRIVEPFCYGTNKRGNEVLRAFQIEGVSESEESFGWKMFLVEEISSLQTLDQTFDKPRPQYNPKDKDMNQIFVAW